MAELKWTDKYGCYNAQFAGFNLAVNWDSMQPKGEPENPQGNYKVHACGFTCQRRAKTVPEGQKLAVLFARKILTEALAALPSEDSNV